MAHIRECICCGKKYDYCPNCGKDSLHPAWMVSFDTETCKEVFNVVSGYNMGKIKADGVNAILKKYNVTDVSIFKDGIKKVLKEVSKPAQPKSEQPKVEMPKVEVQKENQPKNDFSFKKKKNVDVELKEEKAQEVQEPDSADKASAE